MNDYLLTMPTWAPGEFARRQAQFDATLTELSAAMAPCLVPSLRQAVAQAAELVQFTEKGLHELALDEAFLLANYVWSGWLDAAEALPEASRSERLAHACRYALLHAGWGKEAANLSGSVTLALAALEPSVLPDTLPS